MSNTPREAAPIRRWQSLRNDEPELRPLLGIAEVSQILVIPRATLYRWHSMSTPGKVHGPCCSTPESVHRGRLRVLGPQRSWLVLRTYTHLMPDTRARSVRAIDGDFAPKSAMSVPSADQA